MAQEIKVILVDDLDKGKADDTVTFGLDGVSYEIDLSQAHADQLREAFAPWVGHARKLTRGQAARRSVGRTRTGGSGGSGGPGGETAAIRTWARQNGHNVSERGRIAANVVEAYRQAHS